MNYRHAFHAGNHADILKHAALAATLTLLTAKPKPMIALDAFAGAGVTDLRLDERPERTGEWRGGIGRLDLRQNDAPTALHPFLNAVAAANSDAGPLRFYPGSPALALALLREGDLLEATEAHPEESAALARLLGPDPRARVVEGDGWAVAKSRLPPTPRRGLLLLDPPFEKPDEETRLLEALTEGLRRWAVGVYILWRPVKADPIPFERAAAARAGDRPTLACELRVTALEATGGGLASSALTIVNPPYGLEDALAEIGPYLAARLGRGPGAGWRLEMLVPRS